MTYIVYSLGSPGAIRVIGFLYVWMVIATVFTAWALYKPSRPEAIWLADDCFGYDPGAMCPPIFGRYYSVRKHWRYLFSTPARTVIDKQELSKFELVRTGDIQRLSFQHDLETVVIGNCLCESERTWLYTVLEHWRTGRNAAEFALLAERPVRGDSDKTAIVATNNGITIESRRDRALCL